MKLKLLIFILIISTTSCSVMENKSPQSIILLDKKSFIGYDFLTVLKKNDTVLLVTPHKEAKVCYWKEFLKVQNQDTLPRKSKIVGSNGLNYYFYYITKDLNKEYEITVSSAPIGTDEKFFIYSYNSKPYYLENCEKEN